jgi:hypothetical protein
MKLLEENLIEPRNLVLNDDIMDFFRLNKMPEDRVLWFKGIVRKYYLRLCKEMMNRIPIFNTSYDFSKFQKIPCC